MRLNTSGLLMVFFCMEAIIRIDAFRLLELLTLHRLDLVENDAAIKTASDEHRLDGGRLGTWCRLAVSS